MQVGSQWRRKEIIPITCSFLKVWPKKPLIRISQSLCLKIQTLGRQSGFMESKWVVEGPRNLSPLLPAPGSLRTLICLPIRQAQQTCRLGAGCELLQGGGSYSQGLGASGKVSEGGDQAIESWGTRARWRVRMGLPEGKAQHQTMLESSRNGEQRDPKEKGGPGRQ